ncbi:MAG: PorP/SprF family type IX secretion system membrane protein [Bacteroidales bacterium]|nr:PorP/SprF family type IX secretion system membrane protein [Bacteroidales bacterium]
MKYERANATTRTKWAIAVAVLIVAYCSLSAPQKGVAQDIHFSMPDVNPVLFNPAYSGFFEGKGRFGIAYRNQWATVTHPFQTLAASMEMSLIRRRYQHDGLNMGAVMYADQEGTLRYGNNSATAMLSYFKAIGDRNLLSLGLQVGFGISGFDLSDARFGEDDDDIDQKSVHYPLWGAGIAWYFQSMETFVVKIGLAGYNLNRPNISYMGMDNVFLERRFNIYARSEYRGWPSVSVLPMAMAQWQKNYREVLVGSDVKWFLDESGARFLAFSGGLYYRVGDALLATLSMDYNALVFAFSYDANFSKLTPASRSVGAFEMQVIYRLGGASRVKYKAIPCPII